MKFNHLCIAATAVLALAVSNSANAKNDVVVTPASGDPVSVPIESVSSITFDGDKMTVNAASGASVFALSDVAHIKFDLEFQGIEDVTANVDDIEISIQQGVLTATATNDAAVNMSVYNLSGMNVANAAAQGSASVDLNSLPAGVYVVRANSKTIKIIR